VTSSPRTGKENLGSMGIKIAINGIRVSQHSGGGLDHYTIHLVNNIAKLGIPFDLFTINSLHFSQVDVSRIVHPAFFVNKLIPKQNQAPFHGNNLVIQKTMSTKLRNQAGKTLGDPLKMFWTQTIFPLYLKLKKYELLFSPNQLDALPYLPSNLKQVITVHDLIPFLFKEQAHKHKFYLNYLLPKALRNSSHIIVPSSNTKFDLIKFFGIDANKISVIAYGLTELGNHANSPELVEIKKFKELHRLGKYILCVSSNLPHKNLATLIDAFSLIQSKIQCALVIVGYQDQGHQRNLINLVQKNKITDHVKFFDHVSSQKLPLFYGGAEIFVFPSLYEGFGLPPLEAMSFGLPVIVSRSSSLPEVVGNAGIYFDPSDPDNLANKIVEVFFNEKLKNHLSVIARQRAKEFTWEKAAKETVNIFEKVLEVTAK